MITVDKMSLAVREWASLYEDNTDSKDLNLASAISQELARLSTMEFESKISGSIRADYLNEQYQRVIDMARVFTEYACAKGGVILKPYLDNGKIYVSVVQADEFCPVAYSPDGNICGAKFFETFKENGYYFTRIEEHSQKNGVVLISNTAYKSKTKDVLGNIIPLSEVDKWKNIEPLSRIENIKRPLFSYLKMPMANTIDPSSSLGVSAFSKACGLIRDAYKIYNDFLWEYESGKRALYVDESAVMRDENGMATVSDKRLYRLLSTGDDTLFCDWSPVIRNESYSEGLNKILRLIEFNCGLAYGTLSDISYSDKTAEEIKASKQRSYSTVIDIQNSIKKAMKDLIEVMNIYCDIYNLCPDGEYSVSYNFDDSIVCDRKNEFSEKMQLLQKGILNPWEFRAWYFNEDEATARKRIGEINEIQMCDPVAQN